MVEWVAISAGLAVAVLVFHVVSRWWLAVPAAIIAYVVGVNVVGVLWAVIRRLIELGEGIR